MEIKLATYEGPSDLLLRLISRNEIDIYDIPIAQLTAEYLEEVNKLRKDNRYNMDQMSEFILMAATLLEIKSRMLLPKPKTEGTEPEEDPREALVQKLLAYQEAQALAEELTRLSPPGLRLSGPGDIELINDISAEIDNQTPIMEGVDLSQIWHVFTDVMNRRTARRDPERAGFGELPRERFTVPEKVSFIRQWITEAGQVRLFNLFEYCRTRIEMVVTFLAILEMMRQGMIKTRQDRAFEDVYCVGA